MIILSGCKSTIKQDLSPSLTPTLIQLPDQPTPRDYQHSLVTCIIERKVLFNDLQRINKTDIKLNRKWWELWK